MDCIVIKELPKEFKGIGEVRGFEFRRLSFDGFAYLYEVFDGTRTYYEVFERRINPQYNCVRYPRAKAFGIWAFTCYDLAKANDYFGKLSIRVELREEGKE